MNDYPLRKGSRVQLDRLQGCGVVQNVLRSANGTGPTIVSLKWKGFLLSVDSAHVRPADPEAWAEWKREYFWENLVKRAQRPKRLGSVVRACIKLANCGTDENAEDAIETIGQLVTMGVLSTKTIELVTLAFDTIEPRPDWWAGRRLGHIATIFQNLVKVQEEANAERERDSDADHSDEKYDAWKDARS